MKETPKTKKIIFEPKVPVKTEIKTEAKTEQPKKTESETRTREMRGIFAPRGFGVSGELRKETFVFNNLPATATALVEFEDGTYGIRVGEERILECESEFLGDTAVVDVDEKIRKIGDPNLLFTVLLE